ncbi:MAG: M23 family metallopeptidase [Lachnospiraceae bacterium]|nr:M23 family metallopeptidase [Lachnospiraceae bacterium]
MKKSKLVLQKKFISSFVTAAFLILSVLTAYNIKMDKKNPAAQTQTTKETSKSDAVIGPVSGNGEDAEENNDMDVPEEEQMKEKMTEDREESEEQETTAKHNSRKSDSSKEEENTFHYDGKTKLSWPVMGNILLPYSMDATVYYTTLDQYACNDGILIGASVGDEVKSPTDGRIINVTKTDRYGKMVTILLGNYYEISCAQLDDVKYEIGDEVKEGDVIGTVAKPSRAFVLEGPNVFVKMTYKGKPVNPVNYLRS